MPPRNSMPVLLELARVASTSSTASATIDVLGANSSPNASDCMTASVRLPAWYSDAGIFPHVFTNGRPSVSP